MAKLEPGIAEALAVSPPAQVQAYFEEQARRYEAAQWARSTLRQYASQWKLFQRWCASMHFEALPASTTTLRLFVAAELGRVNNRGQPRALTGIRQALAAIQFTHHLHGQHAPIDHPDVQGQLRGARRIRGAIPVAQAEAVTVTDLTLMVAATPRDAWGLRDRALLCVGWAGALRPDEIRRAAWGDVHMVDAGILLSIRDPKGRPGSADTIMLPAASKQPTVCPVAALRAWKGALASSYTADPSALLFPRVDGAGALAGPMKERDVGNVLQARAAAAGIPTRFTGHSLRVGWATSAAEAGKALHLLMLHMRHERVETTARYVQPQRWAEHPSSGLY